MCFSIQRKNPSQKVVYLQADPSGVGQQEVRDTVYSTIQYITYTVKYSCLFI